MSILIKGMEMPTSCVLCRMSEYHVTNPYCKITEAKILRNRERNNDCPLVPVPKHGDLIDRDKLEKDIDKYIGGEESQSRFHHWVQVQDAVIPMDKGEEK